jgi:hypothetical protein
MRRIDQLQAHRAGVVATLHMLPAMPPLALLLGAATERSMRWLLDACEVRTSGLAGVLRVRGMVAVWLWTVRAWERDESADLSATMAALDRALAQAERAAGWLGGRSGSSPGPSSSGPSAPDQEGPPPAPLSTPSGSALAGSAPEEPSPPPPGTPAEGQPGLEPGG